MTSQNVQDEIPWRAIVRVALVSLGNLVGLGLLLPVFPLWVELIVPSSTEVGLATTLTMGVGLIIARPLAGRWMEGRRRAPLMIIGIVINVVSSALYPLVESLTPLLVLRLLQGVGFGWVTTGAVSAMTDLAPPSRRGQMMGYFGAVNALALIIGPGVGTALYDALGFDAVFYGAAGLSMVAALPLMGLREPPKPVVTGRVALTEALRVPALKLLAITHFMTYLLHGAVITFLPKRFYPGGEGTESAADWMGVGTFFAVQAVAVIGFRVVTGKRFDQLERSLFIGGGRLALLAAGVALGLTLSPWALLAVAVLYGLGQGAYLPAANALVGDILPEHLRARGFAIFLLAFDLGFACGGTVAGVLTDLMGVAGAFVIMGTLPGLAWAIQTVAWRRVTAEEGK
ncbi:MAG: MFS transporter [Bradymonadia bacterium]